MCYEWEPMLHQEVLNYFKSEVREREGGGGGDPAHLILAQTQKIFERFEIVFEPRLVN